MINPLHISTEGYLCSPISISTQGYICEVSVEEVIGGLPLSNFNIDKKEDEKLYKIKVKILCNNKFYEEEKIISSKIKPKIEDIKIDIKNKNKGVKINIYL